MHPRKRYRCTFCRTLMRGPEGLRNPCCGGEACRRKAEDAAEDARYRRQLDTGGDQ